jgi:hypothetical protein
MPRNPGSPKNTGLFVVPGNHDIDRDVQKSVWESMRMRLAFSFGRRWRPPGSRHFATRRAEYLRAPGR